VLAYFREVTAISTGTALTMEAPGARAVMMDTLETAGTVDRKQRNFLWYVKFIFACCGAGFGAAILLTILSMPLGLFPWFTERDSGVEPIGAASFVFALVFALLIWRRLR